nr:hypothetical protein [Tanacetum cinerariifolium]
MPNPKDITDPTTAMNMALALMAKAFKLNYSTPTNNQRISSNLRNRQIAQPDPTTAMNMALALMAKAFKLNYSTSTNNQRISSNLRNRQIAQPGNLNGYNAVQNVENQVAQNLRVQNVRNQNGLIGVPGNANHNGNGNLVASRAEGNAAGHNGNQIRCYNCRGVGHFARNCTYTELLEPIPEPHQVPQNDNPIISEDSSVEQSGEIVDQHPVNFEETRALYDSLYQNLAIEVEKVNSVSSKLKETNADLTIELARFKNQEKCFEISQEKYDKLERCYQQSIYQEQCLSKKINALRLNSEKKKLKSDFKIREDELLDKQIQLEKKIKELNNILVKTGQSIQTIHMLSPKPDSFYHTEQKMALGYQNPVYLKQAQKKQQSLYDGKVLFEKHNPPVVHDSEETLYLTQESREKMKQLNKEIKPANYTKINHLSGEAAKFVGDFKSLAKEADESLAKHKALELEIERLLRAVISQDIMSVVQKESVVNTSHLQTELERLDKTKTRRPQPRSNTKNDRVHSASKSSRSKNKEAEVEEHHRNVLLSYNNKHMSSACNNIKLDSQNVISKVVYAM